MNRPKRIGTAAETAVAVWLRANGWPDAERLALRGATDHGDIRARPGLHFEVKGGRAADNASLNQCYEWMEEAATEGRNSGAECLLVVKRKGYGVGRVGYWRLFLPGGYRSETTLGEWALWVNR